MRSRCLRNQRSNLLNMWGDSIPLDRLKEKMTRENLWIYILSLLNEGPKYPYELDSLIEKRFGWRPAKVTSYIVLRSLKSKGLVKMTRRRGESGRMRDYFEITDAGKEMLEKGLEFIKQTYEKLSGKDIC